MSERPIARAVHVCQYVIVERRTNNVSLIHCFTKFLVDRFPSPPERFVVFAALTNGSGTFKITIRISNPKIEIPAFEQIARVPFTDRLQEVRFFVRISNCRFPMPGEYVVELFVEDEPLAMCTFEVALRGAHS